MKEDSNHPGRKLHKYVGNLEFYYETGMECVGTIFHDDRGLSEGPKWDKPDEKMMYKSLEWSVWFGHPLGVYRIRIFNKRNRMVYEGPLTKDKKKIADNDYRYGYLPKEIAVHKWLEYCSKEYRAEVYTNEVVSAIKTDYNITFDIGETVSDDLLPGDGVIINITFDEKSKTVGYWLDNDYLMGGRHPWEITKIDWRKRWKEELKDKKDEN